MEATGTNEVFLKPSKVKQVLIDCIMDKTPVLLRGGSGIGKTDLVGQATKAVSELTGRAHELRPYHIGQVSDVDLRGAPGFGSDQYGEFTFFKPPKEFPRDPDWTGVFFLDEFNRGLPSTQNAALQMLNDRRLGSFVFPDGAAMVGAINPENSEASVGTNRMSQAANTRFMHINVIPDVDDWCAWALANSVEPVIVAFIRFRPELLHKASRTDYAYPNPKAWGRFVNQTIKRQYRDAEIEYARLAGSVGYGPATEFMAFLRTWRTLPNMDAIMLDPAHADVPTDVATVFAVSSALAMRAKPDNLGRVVTYLNRLPGEYAMFAMKDAVSRDPALASTPDFTRWAVANASDL